MTEPEARRDYDVVVIGAGPAGLGAALNLTRARFDVLVLDGNRPRHSATLISHGFPTRDGIAPSELRKLGREELESYDNCEVQFATVKSVTRDGEGFQVEASGIRGSANRSVRAAAVVVATGLAEQMPALPMLRAYYGTSVHSCMMCDGYGHSDKPIALIGETDDLADQARMLSRWSKDLVVFTNGVGQVSESDEAALASAGIRVDRRPLEDLEGDRGGLTGIRVAGGEVVERSAAFVRPIYSAPLEYLDGLELDRTSDGLLVVDDSGRTSLPGLYAAGDLTQAGPQQLIVAAGAGGKVASAVVQDQTRLPA
ncbi:MAG: NAD(P)/FAD-dependent oxidoreductase [Naasia sp.]